jgi:hypothetical protein
MTLDEVIAAGKTGDEDQNVGEKRRSRLMLRRSTESDVNKTEEKAAEGGALESLLLTQVPVSKTRSLKVKVCKKTEMFLI